MKIPTRKIVRVYGYDGSTTDYPQTKTGVTKADARAVGESLAREENGKGASIHVAQGHRALGGRFVRTHEIIVTARVVFADGHEVA
jgi:hypothetical protein